MKKILVLGTVLLFSFGLAGCDLISTEVIEVATEELCREDPTNVLCQVDSLTDLENQVIIDLVNNMLSNYNVEDLESYCETYFSISNIELLDSCKLDENTLFPEGIEDFEVLSVTMEDDEYKVELQSKNYADKIIFSLQIGMDNEQVVVTKMVPGPIYVLSPPNKKADIVDLINMFILKLENDMLTDEQACALINDVDNDCDGIVETVKKFKAGADLSKKVNILDTDDDDDGILTAEISYEIDGHVTVLKIKFDLDNSGEDLQLIFRDIDSEDDMIEGIEKEEIKRIFDLFIVDLYNPDFSSEDLCVKWFVDEGIDNDCDLIKSLGDPVIKHEFIFKSISPIGDNVDNPMFEATYESEFNGHVTVLKIAFTEDDSLEEMKLFIHDIQIDLEEDYLNAEETVAVFRIFLDDYLNPEISFDQFNEDYFNGKLNQESKIGRDTRINNNSIGRLLTEGDPLPGMDLFYKMDVEFTNAVDTEMVSLSIRFIRKEVQDAKNKAVILNDTGDIFSEVIDDDCDIVCDVDDKDEAAMLYQMYIDAYMDSTVTRDILKTYFEIIPSEDYFDTRDKLLSSGDQIEFVAIIGPNVTIGTYAGIAIDSSIGTYIFIYDIVKGDEKNRHIEPVVIRKRVDASTPLLSILDPDDDGDSIPTEEKLVVLNDFKNNLNDDSLIMEDFFAQIILKDTDETTCPLSTPVHCSKAEGYNIDSIDLLEVGGLNYIIISQRPNLLTSDLEDIDVSYFVYFYYDYEKSLMFELVPIDSIPN